jgi:hypothetical protein
VDTSKICTWLKNWQKRKLEILPLLYKPTFPYPEKSGYHKNETHKYKNEYTVTSTWRLLGFAKFCLRMGGMLRKKGYK